MKMPNKLFLILIGLFLIISKSCTQTEKKTIPKDDTLVDTTELKNYQRTDTLNENVEIWKNGKFISSYFDKGAQYFWFENIELEDTIEISIKGTRFDNGIDSLDMEFSYMG